MKKSNRGRIILTRSGKREKHWILMSVNPARPAVENAILERLGDAPFSVGRTNLNSLLSKAYETASRTALQTASGDSDEE